MSNRQGRQGIGRCRAIVQGGEDAAHNRGAELEGVCGWTIPEELFPALTTGWLNGWILLALLYLMFGALLPTFPKDLLAALYEYDRSGLSERQKASQEEACLEEYGASHRADMERVPRYFLFL